MCGSSREAIGNKMRPRMQVVPTAGRLATCVRTRQKTENDGIQFPILRHQPTCELSLRLRPTLKKAQ
jgi:hypothetical protein